METLLSSEVRTNWGKTFDKVVYKGPALIEKNNHINLLLSGSHLASWLGKEYPITYVRAVEDGVVMIGLSGIPDIFGYGATTEEAAHDLAGHLQVLTEEMYDDFERFSAERPRDVFYLLQISMMDRDQVERTIAVAANG